MKNKKKNVRKVYVNIKHSGHWGINPQSKTPPPPPFLANPPLDIGFFVNTPVKVRFFTFNTILYFKSNKGLS